MPRAVLYYLSAFKLNTCLALIIGVLSAGCAFIDDTIPLPQSGSTTGYTGGNGRVLVVPPFINRRSEERIGMVKNGYGMDTASVFANQNVEEWLASRLREELTSAGFHVNRQGEHLNATTVQGITQELFIEPVTVSYGRTDYESDIAVLIRMSRPDGLEAERRYYAKGSEHEPGYYKKGMDELFKQEDPRIGSLRKSSDDLMKRVVADIINLLNRFPESQVGP